MSEETSGHNPPEQPDACGSSSLRDALRESELRLQNLADNLPDAMVYQITAEPDGGRRFTYVSRAVVRLNEVTPEEVLADSMKIYGQMLPEYIPLVRALEEEAIRTRSTLRVEVQSVLPSGRTRWFAYASTPRYLADGLLVWDGVEVDVTERKLAEEELERRVAERTDELKEACAQLRHAQKLESLGVLAGGIAHDFNNILQIILGNVQQTKRIVSELSPARPLLDNIENAAGRAAILTRQMLAYAGKGAFNIQPLDLGEAISEISHLVRSALSKKVTLRTSLETGIAPIEADPAQIQQVAMNLIMNAAEALDPDHGGLVTVAVSQGSFAAGELRGNRTLETLPEGEYVCLSVSDTGCGMDAPTLERLFDPFFTTKFTGRGLGMSAVLGIARAHKAAVLVNSRPGEGTTIRALFPAAERREASCDEPVFHTPAAPPGRSLHRFVCGR